MSHSSILRCPVCSADLSRDEKTYRCENNHSFDIARQGYVNLLLSSHRPSKSPGDSSEMIVDRRAFLDAGFYAPLRDRIAEALMHLQISSDHTRSILDLGCGEGYYTAKFAEADNRQVFGLDIAKPALAIAARRSDNVVWCVGNSRALPFHDQCFDAVLNIFCRPHWREIQRVLRDNGVLIFVGPGQQHLRELREVLYENVSTHDDESPDTAAQNGFAQTHMETLEFPLTLRQPAILQLARMTPHYWRASSERRAQLEQLEELSVRAEFVIRQFSKT